MTEKYSHALMKILDVAVQLIGDTTAFQTSSPYKRPGREVNSYLKK